MAEHAILDLRPRPSPENPYALLAQSLRAMTSPTVRAVELAAWCDSLAVELPVKSADPLLLGVLGRAAVDGDARRWLVANLAELTAAIAARG